MWSFIQTKFNLLQKVCSEGWLTVVVPATKNTVNQCEGEDGRQEGSWQEKELWGQDQPLECDLTTRENGQHIPLFPSNSVS